MVAVEPKAGNEELAVPVPNAGVDAAVLFAPNAGVDTAMLFKVVPTPNAGEALGAPNTELPAKNITVVPLL